MSELLNSIERWWGITIGDIEKERIRRPSEMLQFLMDSQEIENGRNSPWQYKSLARMAKEYILNVGGPNNEKTDFSALNHALADAYGMHLGSFRYFLSEGLRLYVNDGDSYREGNDNDPDWHYFRLMAERDEDISTSTYESPTWATNLFLKYENHRIWHAITWDVPSTNDPEYAFVKLYKRRAVDALMDGYMDAAPQKKSYVLTMELQAALDAFEAVHGDPSATVKRTPKNAIKEWLKANKPDLSENARKRIATVANWQPGGGAPKTPGE